MKKIFLILAFLPIFHLVQSQDKSDKILQKSAKKIKSYSTIVAEFDFIMQNKEENLNDTYKGKIYLKKKKYLLHLMDVATYFDGEKLYSYLLDANEVTISKPDENEEDALNPATIFTIFEDGFAIKFIDEVKANKKTLFSIDLFPEDKDTEYTKLNIKIDKSTYHPVEFVSYGKDGNNVLLHINSFTPQVPLNDTFFTFDFSKHKDIEIVDMQ